MKFLSDINGALRVIQDATHRFCTDVEKAIWNGNQYSVKSYGAVGGGVVDDTAAFIACVAAAPKGTKIITPNDTYKLTSQIVDNVGHQWDFDGSIINTSSYDDAFLFAGTLKTTKTVTAAYHFYTGTVSDNKLTLDSVTNIAVGDLANIVSTELFDTTRSYFFKGGNFLIKKIIGNDIYIDGTMPFEMDISTHTITVKIYSAISPIVKNIGMLNGTTALDAGSGYNLGLQFMFCKDVLVENIKTQNFKANVEFHECVNAELHVAEVGHAQNSEDWAYGVSIFSSTNVTIRNLITNSGTTGLVWTGQEPSYNIIIEDCNLCAESSYEGLGSHANCLGVTLTACILNGFSFQGNVHAINCDMMNNEITATSAYLGLGEQYFQSNYSFDRCRFYNQLISVRDYFQIDSATRKYIGSITFTNCSGFQLSINVNVLRSGAKVAMINRVLIENCNDWSISWSDLIDTLTIRDSVSSYNTNNIKHCAYNSVYQNVKNVWIENIKLPKQFNGIGIYKADNVVIKGFNFSALDNGSSEEDFSNILNLYLENFDNTGSQRGMVLIAIGKLTIINCNLVFRTLTATQLNACTKVSAKGMTADGICVDVITGSDATNPKYQCKITGATTGVWVMTKY